MAYIWRGDLTEGFLRYEIGGLIFGGLIDGGAYFRNCTVLFCNVKNLLVGVTLKKQALNKLLEQYLKKNRF